MGPQSLWTLTNLVTHIPVRITTVLVMGCLRIAMILILIAMPGAHEGVNKRVLLLGISIRGSGVVLVYKPSLPIGVHSALVAVGLPAASTAGTGSVPAMPSRVLIDGYPIVQ